MLVFWRPILIARLRRVTRTPPLSTDIPTSMLLSGRGEGETPGNVKDFDYYHGVGNGGKVSYDGGGGKGSEGAAVIIARVPGIPLPSRTTFFYSGEIADRTDR